MNTRETAKGYLTDSEGKLVLVAGKSGKFSFIGGEVNDGEWEHEAFGREAKEEVDLDEEWIHGLEEAFVTDGVTTSRKGELHLTFSTVFRGIIPFPCEELYIPSGSEITRICGMNPEEALIHPDVQALTKQGIQRALDLGL